MKIYLASRYSRREELCGYRDQLVELGHTITSRWLNGSHQISDEGAPIGDHGEALVEGDDGSTSARAAQLREGFAREDIADVVESDALIAFTEPPRSDKGRGGRHVELGVALGWNCLAARHDLRLKQIFIVGYRENIFCWLPVVTFFESWPNCREYFSDRRRV